MDKTQSTPEQAPLEGSLSDIQDQAQESLTTEAHPLDGAQPVEAQADVPTEAAAVGEKIRIGDKTFSTTREAMEYAEALERENLAQSSYQQGILDALSRGEKPPSPQVMRDEFDMNEEELERFYANPKDFLRQFAKRITSQVTTDINQSIEKQNKVTQLWNEFYSENPDLSGDRDLVQMILTQEWDTLGNISDHKKAMKILAQKTRDRVQKISNSLKPRAELPNSQRGASPGGQPLASRSMPAEKPLDFLSQLHQAQSKRHASARR